MPQIVFSILATPEQRAEISQDFHQLLAANSDLLTATLRVRTDVPVDPGLVEVWREHGFSEGPAEGAEAIPESAALTIDISEYRGSLSGLSMRLSEVLTEREKQPAEALFQQVLDDPGAPRVPWHVEVRP